jgi:hypothetical protein
MMRVEMWELTTATDLEDSKGGKDRLDELLFNQWEPFAATSYGTGWTLYHLRRKIWRDA